MNKIGGKVQGYFYVKVQLFTTIDKVTDNIFTMVLNIT